ncbi:MAG: O-antigen ligase family protein [bacterium]
METLFYNPLLLVLIFVSFWERFTIPLWFSLNASLIVLPVYLLWVVVVAVRRKVLHQLFILPKPIVTILLIVLLSQIFSLFATAFPSKVLNVVVFQCLKFIILISVMHASRKSSFSKKMIASWLWGSSLVALAAIYQFVVYKFGISPVLFPEWLLTQMGFVSKALPADHFTFPIGSLLFIRPSSTFIDTNAAAGFLAVSMVLLINLFIKKDVSRVQPVVLFVLHFVAFSMMLSRSAWVGFIVALGCLFYFRRQDFGKLHISKKILVPVGGLLLIPFCFFVFRFFQTLRFADESTQGHMSFAVGALKMWFMNPLTGVGAGTFEQSYIKIIDPSLKTAYSHSIYLQWLAETGILGFVANLALVFYVVKESLVSLKKRMSVEVVGLLCGLVVLLVANVLYAYFPLIPTYVLMGLLLGMSAQADLKAE